MARSHEREHDNISFFSSIIHGKNYREREKRAENCSGGLEMHCLFICRVHMSVGHQIK